MQTSQSQTSQSTGGRAADWDTQEVLRRVFGFEEFLQGQQEVISRLLDGRSTVAIFPTGAGKSLCFQLPAMMLDGLTLVISPLIALMKDQLDFLTSRGVPAARLDSSLDRDQTLKVYDDLNAGRLKMLYISPERLGNERFLQSLKRREIAMLAVDEAHCISEWGHNFRPDYLKIARMSRQLKAQRVLALTATATPDVARDIAARFRVEKEDVVQTGFYRPNLHLHVSPCRATERRELLLSRLSERPAGPTIVYVTLQRTAEQIAEFLRNSRFDARAYHAGMETEQRTAVQEAFMASDRLIVVATIAFGMGIDKSDIRAVYHYNLPKSMENYAQEIGRAGRDGKPSHCELLACADDVVTLENFSYGDTPTPEAIDGAIEEILGQGPVFDVSVYELSGGFDIRPLVVKTLLAYLELENVIQSTGPFYSGFKFQPLRPSQEILSRFNPDRADFLRSIFRHARKGKKWFSLDVEETAHAIGHTRDRVVAALSYLEETGDLELQVSGVRQGYRMLQSPADQGALYEKLSQRFAHREQRDIERTRRILEFAEHDGCSTQFLLSYFGESRDDCNHCGRCNGDAASALPPPSYTAPGDAQMEQVGRLQSENHKELASPRQLTRFLCGISSPAAVRAKLRAHPMFGTFESVPFNEVLALTANLPRR